MKAKYKTGFSLLMSQIFFRTRMGEKKEIRIVLFSNTFIGNIKHANHIFILIYYKLTHLFSMNNNILPYHILNTLGIFVIQKR